MIYKFWMVCKEQCSPYISKHTSRDDALEEMLALADINKGERFYLLEAVKCYMAPFAVPTELKMVIKREVKK